MGSASYRNRVTKKSYVGENELRFRDDEFGKSVDRLDGDVSRYLKCASEVLDVLNSVWNIFW